MSKNTVTITPCPAWCDHKHPDEEWHERVLARVDGPLSGTSHSVFLDKAMHPENGTDERVHILIRGNGIDDVGSQDVPWTVTELLDVSAMFARAAAALGAAQSA